jgi:hypothetical protein
MCYFHFSYSFLPSERLERGGPSLLTVETQVNGDSKNTNERSPSLVGLSGRHNRFLSCLGCSSRPSTKYFSSLYPTISIPKCPYRSASHSSRSAGSPVSGQIISRKFTLHIFVMILDTGTLNLLFLCRYYRYPLCKFSCLISGSRPNTFPYSHKYKFLITTL